MSAASPGYGGIEIERDEHSQQYVTLHNRVARDKRLSRRARGLLAELLSYPHGHRVTSETLAESGPEGRDAIRAALAELETCGYLARTRSQGERGRWSTRLTVRETPADFIDRTAPARRRTRPAQPPMTAPPTTENPSSVPPAETRVCPGRAEDGFPVVGKPGAKELKDKDQKNLSVADVVTTRLASAGLPHGEREIRLITQDLTRRTGTTDPGRMLKYLSRISPTELGRVLSEAGGMSAATDDTAAAGTAAGRHPSARPVAAVLHGQACPHGCPDGAAACPFCRAGAAPADEAPARTRSRGAEPPADLIAETKRKLATLAGAR